MIEYLQIRENWEFALWIGVALMVGIPTAISLYYHITVRRIPGGKELRAAQAHHAPNSVDAVGNFNNGLHMWRLLRRGAFGAEASKLVNRCILGMLIWVVTITVWFGVLLYVDAQMMANGGWPGFEIEPANPAPNTLHGLDGGGTGIE